MTTASVVPDPTFVSTVDPNEEDFEDLLDDDVDEPRSDLSLVWFDEIVKMTRASMK